VFLSSGLNSEEQAREIFKRLLMYVFLLLGGGLLCTLTTHGQVEIPENSGAKPEPDQYQTLAQFYEAIKDGKP
jgi:hypothetical protein